MDTWGAKAEFWEIIDNPQTTPSFPHDYKLGRGKKGAVKWTFYCVAFKALGGPGAVNHLEGKALPSNPGEREVGR